MQERHRPHQQEKRGTRRGVHAGDVERAREPGGRVVRLGIGVGMLPVEARDDGPQFKGRACRRRVGSEPGDDADEVLVGGQVLRIGEGRRHRRREPELRAIGEPAEALRHHADHVVRDTVDAHRLADDVSPPPKAALPEVVPDDHNGDWRCREAVARGEWSSPRGSHPERGEVRGRDEFAADGFGVAAPREVDLRPRVGGQRRVAARGIGQRRQAGMRPARLAPRSRTAGMSGIEHHQPLGVGERRGAPERGPRQGEGGREDRHADGDGAGDADRQRAGGATHGHGLNMAIGRRAGVECLAPALNSVHPALGARGALPHYRGWGVLLQSMSRGTPE